MPVLSAYRRGMYRWIRTSMSARSLFAAMMLLGLAMRIAVPAGFMPTASDRGVVVAICTGQGVLSHVIDLGPEDAGGKEKSTQGHCLYASATDGGLPSAAVQQAAPLWLPIVQMLGAAIADLTVHRLAAPPPPSQAPPARA